ncbi:MAG: S-layer homology domain-containing protein [Clostridia bacterium]|nr:S-layer homology domain-containing protein [Clostridia bacterium]
MKRIILLVVFILLFPKTILAHTDIENHWAQDFIIDLTGRGIIEGYPDNTFRPDNNVTKAEFVTLLIKSLDIPVKDSEGHWAEGFVTAAKNKNIIDDVGNLDETITRGDVIRMIARSSDAKIDVNNIKTIFVDTLNLDEELLKSIEMLYNTGILSGFPDKTVRTAFNLTRAEACTFICKLLENKEKLDTYNYVKNYYDETVFISKEELPHKLELWKNSQGDSSVKTIINSVDVFEFNADTKYSAIFEEIKNSENQYFEYRRKKGTDNFVIAIEFETKNDSKYETVTGYDYLNVSFPEEDIKILDSFDTDEIENAKKNIPYDGKKLKQEESHKTVAFYIVGNKPSEVIKLTRNITTMYDEVNKEYVDTNVYSSLVIGNL